MTPGTTLQCKAHSIVAPGGASRPPEPPSWSLKISLRVALIETCYIQSLDIRKQIFTDITHHRLVCLQRAPLFNQFPRLIVREKGDLWVFRAPSSHTHTGVGTI